MSIAYGISNDWAKETDAGRTHIATKGVYANNLVFNIDFGSNSCYSGSGTSLIDLTGSYTGTLVNGPTFSSSTTFYYGGLTFDGINDSISFGNIGTSSNVSFSNNFTIEQIFTPTGYQPGAYYGLTNMLIAKGTASTYNYATQVSSDTTFSFVKRTSPETLFYNTFTVPSMAQKVNVVTLVVQNGSNTSSDTITCYHNGVLIGTQNIDGAAITPVTNDPFNISGLGVANGYFIGTYYACRMYNTALTSTDVAKNFNVIRRRYGL